MLPQILLAKIQLVQELQLIEYKGECQQTVGKICSHKLQAG
jgi:hypothetical protein